MSGELSKYVKAVEDDKFELGYVSSKAVIYLNFFTVDESGIYFTNLRRVKNYKLFSFKSYKHFVGFLTFINRPIEGYKDQSLNMFQISASYKFLLNSYVTEAGCLYDIQDVAQDVMIVNKNINDVLTDRVIDLKTFIQDQSDSDFSLGYTASVIRSSGNCNRVKEVADRFSKKTTINLAEFPNKYYVEKIPELKKQDQETEVIGESGLGATIDYFSIYDKIMVRWMREEGYKKLKFSVSLVKNMSFVTFIWHYTKFLTLIKSQYKNNLVTTIIPKLLKKLETATKTTVFSGREVSTILGEEYREPKDLPYLVKTRKVVLSEVSFKLFSSKIKTAPQIFAKIKDDTEREEAIQVFILTTFYYVLGVYLLQVLDLGSGMSMPSQVKKFTLRYESIMNLLYSEYISKRGRIEPLPSNKKYIRKIYNLLKTLSKSLPN